MYVLSEPYFAFLNLCFELLPTGFPLNSEFSMPAFATVVRKAKKIKGFRLTIPFFVSSLFCIPAKFDNFRFIFHYLQIKFSQPFFHLAIKLFRIVFILKEAYIIVSISYQICLTSAVFPHFHDEP